jgi:hypothetical protein
LAQVAMDTAYRSTDRRDGFGVQAAWGRVGGAVPGGGGGGAISVPSGW